MNYPLRPPPEFVYTPPEGELEIIHKDEEILVLSKPSGLLCVPGRKPEHQDSLELRVKEQFPELRIIHRLDMDTSGIVIMAMNPESHRNIGLQFERRKTKKTYIARIWGHPEDDEGEIDQPLICDWPNRPIQKIDLTRGKSAITKWQVLEREEGGLTRIALNPITGRTHQLRVHMAEMGHPILGDDFYAHEKALKAADRLQLHAYKLTVHHPSDGRLITFEAPCPF